ncbi:MAG: hypothetical protein LBP56_07030 [Odoribacteraceae bacterium]|jgi:hypothetical protein|nr:hypothetical protein [Odoribacteraceae bacterium]
MSNIQSKTDALFLRWKQAYEKEGYTGFCADGLLYRGGNWDKEVAGEQYHGKYEGDEENMWLQAPKRLLFLLKDTNGNPGEDLREFRPGANGSIALHYKNLAYWTYGLLAFDETHDAPAFDALDFWEEAFPAFDQKPLAIVNCKKEAGKGSINPAVLQEHIDRYAPFIKEQIEILDPDIIVCGGGSSVIKEFVANHVYPGIVKVNNWVYYDDTRRKVVIDSYHPSYRFEEVADMYTGMMDKYKEFLAAHPEFRKSSRK